MLNLLTRLPAYRLTRFFGRPAPLPFSYTVSVTNRCQCRCLTCRVYEKPSGEMDLPAYDKIFQNLGRRVIWVTFSGGEPFLRKDFADIVKSCYNRCKPAVINIPTNGMLHEKIPETVMSLADHCRESGLVVNLSLDDIGERHDKIRGCGGAFEKAMLTFRALKQHGRPNLTLGIHTVISRYNQDRIPEIHTYMRQLEPDSYVTEAAEERRELGTVGEDIGPSPEKYGEIADFLCERMKESKGAGGVPRLVRVFRSEYYRLAARILRENRQVIPCYAGYASCQIDPGGDVWMCCVRAVPIGNLPASGYDFKSVWQSAAAGAERRKIKDRACGCPLANAAYTNMLLHGPTCFRLGRRLMGWSGK
jgi:MoaA/NifB/PqqE/SkfB family radical SAM enzyme